MRWDMERQRDFAEDFLPKEVGRAMSEQIGAVGDGTVLEAMCRDVSVASVLPGPSATQPDEDAAGSGPAEPVGPDDARGAGRPAAVASLPAIGGSCGGR